MNYKLFSFIETLQLPCNTGFSIIFTVKRQQDFEKLLNKIWYNVVMVKMGINLLTVQFNLSIIFQPFLVLQLSDMQRQRQQLLSSMQKLIKYIQISIANQWEIFESLSKKDIIKILNNFNDSDPKIRKLSLALMGSLLDGNNDLKVRLCERMGITPIPGKICLNIVFPTIFDIQKDKTVQLLNLLKQHVNKYDQIFPIWMLNPKSEVLKVDFIPLSTLNYIDPAGHLIGFTLLEDNTQTPKKTFLNLVGLLTESPKRQIRIKKPSFKVAPLSDRSSSFSTEYSNRFNRTPRTLQSNKTSLKQSLKRSLIVQGSQKEENVQKLDFEKETKERQRFQSEWTDSQKIRRNQQTYSTQIINDYCNCSKKSGRNEKFAKETPAIVNNTNIYITGSISEISVRDGKVEFNSLIEQKGFKSQRNDCELTINKSPQHFTVREYISNSCENECNIFIRPFKKYERKTNKQDTVKDMDQFDYNKCRQYLKKINNEGWQKQVYKSQKIFEDFTNNNEHKKD